MIVRPPMRKPTPVVAASAWIVTAGVLLLLGCGAPSADGPAADSPHEEDHEAEAVALSEEEIEEFGIEVVPAGPARILDHVRLPGEVRPNADRLAHIVPRFSGIVSEVRANLGDEVRAGQVLAVIESDESLYPYELKTLIGGTVIAKHITPGEAVSRGTESFVIADLGTVWIELTVYQKELDRVRTGQHVLISTGHDPEETSGTISYVTPVVDEATRTATARVVLPNPDRRWRPGMFVNARVLVGDREVPVGVPATALHTVDGETVVFVQSEHGFEPREVKTGRRGDRYVEIESGLEPGERYVSEGGFTIKAALAKESFGGGHGH